MLRDVVVTDRAGKIHIPVQTALELLLKVVLHHVGGGLQPLLRQLGAIAHHMPPACVEHGVGREGQILHARVVGYAAAHAVEVVQPIHIVDAVEVAHRADEVVHILAVAEVHIKAVPRCDKRREVEAGKQVVPVALGGFAAVFLGSALLVVKHIQVANGVFHPVALGGRLVVDVTAIIHHRREPVGLAEAVHEFGCNVIVLHVGIWLHGVGIVVELLQYGPGQLAEIRHAPRHVKRGVPLPYRALGLDAAR